METTVKSEIEQLARLLAWRELALRYLDLNYPDTDNYESYFYLSDDNRMRLVACILDYDVLHPRVKLYEDVQNFVDIAVDCVKGRKTLKKNAAAEFIENWFKIN